MQKTINSNFIKKYPLIFKKYKPLKKIANGAFSEVYAGMNIVENKKIAIKIEDKNCKKPLLQSETFFLFTLKGIGIPQVLSYGVNKEYNILVMPLLGKNLLEIYKEKNGNFEFSDICLIAIQIIDRIEYIHNKYIIHKDIKPENFLLGLNDPDLIYLIDFGLSKKYKSGRTGNHIRYQNIMKFIGNISYASSNALRGWEQSRRDDLESVGYMLIYFLKGTLPWRDYKLTNSEGDYIKISQIKKNIKTQRLCAGLPKEFSDYMNYVKNLNFEQCPDYNYLRNLFKNLLYKKKLLNIISFSWVNNDYRYKDNNWHKKTCVSYHRKSSSRQRLYNQIKERLSSLNKSNNENTATNNSSNTPNTASLLPKESGNTIKFFDEGKNKKSHNMRPINCNIYNENDNYFNYKTNNTEYNTPTLGSIILNDNNYTSTRPTIAKEDNNENFYSKTGYLSFKGNNPDENLNNTVKTNPKNTYFVLEKNNHSSNNINKNKNELYKNQFIKNASINLYKYDEKNPHVNIYNSINNITLINNKPIINNYNIINNNFIPLHRSQKISNEKKMNNNNQKSDNYMKIITNIKKNMPRIQKKAIVNNNLKIVSRANPATAKNTYTKVNINDIKTFCKPKTDVKKYKYEQKSYKKNKPSNFKSDGYRYKYKGKTNIHQNEHCLII